MRKLIRKLFKPSWGLPPDPQTTYCPSPESDDSLRKNWLQAIGHRLSAISGFTEIHVVLLKLQFIDYNLSINSLYKQVCKIKLLKLKKTKVGWVKRRDRMLAEKVVHGINIEKAKLKLEICLNIDDVSAIRAELEEFYREVADKNIQSLEETKKIALECNNQLKILLDEMKKLTESEEISLERIARLNNILNTQSKIINEYWDYLPYKVKDIFKDLYTNISGEKIHTKKNKEVQYNFLNYIKLKIQNEYLKLTKSQDVFNEFSLSYNRFIKAFKDAENEDIQDELDWKEVTEIRKKIYNGGAINWDDI